MSRSEIACQRVMQQPDGLATFSFGSTTVARAVVRGAVPYTAAIATDFGADPSFFESAPAVSAALSGDTGPFSDTGLCGAEQVSVCGSLEPLASPSEGQVHITSTARYQSDGQDLNAPCDHGAWIEGPPSRPVIVAHQGAQGVQGYPANSAAAILSAIERGARSVEFDTYSVPRRSDSSTREVVIIHPEGFYFYVDRGGMRNDAQIPRSFEELRDVRVDGVQLVPTLREILDQYPALVSRSGVRTRLEIELKGPETAEAVVPIVQEYIAKGAITYDDVTLCAFCYAGEEKSRLEIARALDSRITLSLSVRGGDFQHDAFGSWDEVFDFARRLDVAWLDVSRRNLTAELVKRLHGAGFKVTCHHLRTTDELQHAIALGVDSIRADMFAGPTLSDYSELHPVSTRLLDDLRSSGFCRVSDWIWEIGHEVRRALEHAEGRERPLLTEGSHAVVTISQQGTVSLVPCVDGARSGIARDLSNFRINPEYLSTTEARHTPEGRELKDLLDWSALARAVSDHLPLLTAVDERTKMRLAEILESALPHDLAAVAERKNPRLLKKFNPPLKEDAYREVVQLIEGALTRIGRTVGMLAISAARPLENPRQDYVVSIQSPYNFSETFRTAVAEQLAAHSLRTGSKCSHQFQGSDDLQINFPLAYDHLKRFPFRPPTNVNQCVAWYEGSFNPIHSGHIQIIRRLVEMGFKTVIVGTVPQNPHKPKNQIFPFDKRVRAVREALVEEGFELAATPDEPGIYVTPDATSFYDERFRAWFRDDRWVVMGPDNFDVYFRENRPWALMSAESPEMREFTRFQRLYERGLAARILVNDEEYPFHSTNVREGESPSLPAVRRILGDEIANYGQHGSGSESD